MRRPAPPLSGLALLALAGCTGTGPSGEITFDFDFSADAQGFEAAFTDVAVDQVEAVEFQSGHRPLPAPLEGGGLYQFGVNVSDDLFMFFRRRVVALEPGRTYRTSFTVEIASAVQEGCAVGVGTSVWVKAGAAAQRPERVVESPAGGSPRYRLSVDKGEQASRGEAAVVLGDMRNGLPGCPATGATWNRKSLADPGATVDVTADPDGGVWLFFGSESGFEVPHELFFTRLGARLVPR